MRGFITRLAEVPEWRALATERLTGTAVQARPPQPAVPPELRPKTEGGSPGGAKEILYTCPMHPDVASIHPGKCPKCGMALEPVDA